MKYIYYACNGKRNPNYKCDNGSVKRDWIEDIVVQATKEFVKGLMLHILKTFKASI